jgi:hydroxymethylpyrimidine pyrophosphatase-like HAD family hydrolase
MRFHALATDYDGTIATGGVVPESTFEALDRLRRAGRRAVLVTGRELDDLKCVCPRLEAFDLIVAENGALLYEPASGEEIPLAAAPPPEFIAILRQRNVHPLSVGRVIVATWQPHETTTLEVIRDLGLEMQVIFNKGAVMILPSGVNKATGLSLALEHLGLSAHNVVAVGDAENDHALCKACEVSAAVANALPALKDAVDLVLENHHGAGVEESIHRLLSDDLQSLEPRLVRHHLPIGTQADGARICVRPYGINILVTGPENAGKSTFAKSFTEQLGTSRYQFCFIDPDGSYSALAHATSIGLGQASLDVAAVVQLLEKPGHNAHVNLADVAAAERPAVFQTLIVAVEQLRTKTGRPHWLLIDDAERLLPDSSTSSVLPLPVELCNVALITESPGRMSNAALRQIDIVAVLGSHASDTLSEFCQAIGRTASAPRAAKFERGHILWWPLKSSHGPLVVRCYAGEHDTTASSLSLTRAVPPTG